jgi:gas vesicle protein
MKNNVRLLIAFASGLVSGAMLGILFAPDTGMNTRQKISFQLEKYIRRLNDLLAGLRRNSDEKQTASTTNQPQEYQKAEQLLREVENLLDDIKTK